jgi:hypothetical protein
MRRLVTFLLASFIFIYATAQNVGVGITIPTSNLHVYSATSTDAKVESNSAFGSSSVTIKTPGGVNDYLKLAKNGSSASGSQAGISLNNLSQIITGANSGALMIGNVTSNPIYFITDNTERMRIAANGNVGINVTNPLWPLHVSGTGTYTVWSENASSSTGYSYIAVNTANDGAGMASVAGTNGETISSYEPGRFALLGTTGAATAVGAYTTTGTAIRARAETGMALYASGGIRLTGISEGNNKVLTSDASGNATWQTFNSNPQTGFFVVLSAPQSIPNSSFTQFSTMLEGYDDGNNLDGTTGSNTFTVPANGVYHFTASIYWPAPIAGTLVRVQILTNGVPSAGSEGSFTLTTNGMTTEHSLDAKLNAGNTVTVRVFQNSGVALNIGGGIGAVSSTFSGFRVY